MSNQRRMPITYAEFEELAKTGELPLMTDTIKPGKKPYCHNCKHWHRIDDFKGECKNIDARKHALFGDGCLGAIERLKTGASCHCPKHSFKNEM